MAVVRPLPPCCHRSGKTAAPAGRNVPVPERQGRAVFCRLLAFRFPCQCKFYNLFQMNRGYRPRMPSEGGLAHVPRIHWKSALGKGWGLGEGKALSREQRAFPSLQQTADSVNTPWDSGRSGRQRPCRHRQGRCELQPAYMRSSRGGRLPPPSLPGRLSSSRVSARRLKKRSTAGWLP